MAGVGPSLSPGRGGRLLAAYRLRRPQAPPALDSGAIRVGSREASQAADRRASRGFAWSIVLTRVRGRIYASRSRAQD